MPPKEIAGELLERFGVTVSADYIRAIRAASLARGETLFVGGSASPAAVFEWLRNNPNFRKRGFRP